MSDAPTATYDVAWGRGYSQVFSSFSALVFVVAGGIIGIRLHLPGNTLPRFLGLLLSYKGLAAFWNHAVNEANPSLRYLDFSAQLWLVNQIFVWVVIPQEPYFWLPRIMAAFMAHLGGGFVGDPPSLVWCGIILTQIASMFVAILIHEYYHRRRWLAVASLGAFAVLLCVVYILRNETAIFLGQFGMCWVNLTQVYLILGWYIFWSQRDERTLIWGCGESLNAVYCC